MELYKMYEGKVNSPATKLKQDINATDTIIPVEDVSVFPSPPNLAVIGIDESAETILYAAIDKAASTLSGCTRAKEGTAKIWPQKTPIARNFTNYDYETLRQNVQYSNGAINRAEVAALKLDRTMKTGDRLRIVNLPPDMAYQRSDWGASSIQLLISVQTDSVEDRACPLYVLSAGNTSDTFGINCVILQGEHETSPVEIGYTIKDRNAVDVYLKAKSYAYISVVPLVRYGYASTLDIQASTEEKIETEPANAVYITPTPTASVVTDADTHKWYGKTKIGNAYKDLIVNDGQVVSHSEALCRMSNILDHFGVKISLYDDEAQKFVACFEPFSYLKDTGGTMTGAITLSGAPTKNLHAATKKYVDDASKQLQKLVYDTVRAFAIDNNLKLAKLAPLDPNAIIDET